MKHLKTALAALLLWTVLPSMAQNSLPSTAKLADDNGFQQIYLNYETAPDDDEDIAPTTSVWICDKRQRTTKRLLTTNPDAQGAWDRMQNHNAVTIPMTQIAIAVKARFVTGDNKIIVEGCPDARNIYSYLIDLEQNTALQLPSNSGFVGFCGEDETYIVMQSYRYNPDIEVGGRFPVLSVYDTHGKFIKELEVR